MTPPSGSAYVWILLASVAITAAIWRRMSRKDPGLMTVYAVALPFAFFGGKLAFLLAEGWLHLCEPDPWPSLLAGKSITGALLGGYVGVEVGKVVARRPAPTGDWFAIVAPLGIMVGRLGCLFHGCCLGAPRAQSWFTVVSADGVARWPAVHAEILFNFAALLAALAMDRLRILPNQHFNIYLAAYGAFRFVHEFWRDTPRLAGDMTGYHLVSAAMVAVGVAGFVHRARHPAPPPPRN